MFLLLISCLIPLYFKSIYYMISIFFNLLKFILWLRIWSVLENSPSELENNIHSVVIVCSILQLSIRFSWLMVIFRSTVPFLIFCLLSLSIPDIRVLRSLPIIVDLSIFPYSSDSFCLIYFDIVLLDEHMLRNVISSWKIRPFYIV